MSSEEDSSSLESPICLTTIQTQTSIRSPPPVLLTELRSPHLPSPCCDEPLRPNSDPDSPISEPNSVTIPDPPHNPSSLPTESVPFPPTKSLPSRPTEPVPFTPTKSLSTESVPTTPTESVQSRPTKSHLTESVPFTPTRSPPTESLPTKSPSTESHPTKSHLTESVPFTPTRSPPTESVPTKSHLTESVPFTPTESLRSLPTDSNLPHPTDSEIESALRSLERFKTLPDPTQSKFVMDLINRRKVAALYRSDYDEAARLEALASDLISTESETIRRRCEEDRSLAMSKHLEELYEHHGEEESHWKALLAENRAEHKEKGKLLQAQQNLEIDEFKTLWQSVDYVKQFHRPSVRLLQFRHIEKKLVLQKKYIEAKKMKKVADEVQEEEEEIAQKLLDERMRGDFMKLREKHRLEFQKLNEFYELTANELRLKMKKSLEPLGNALKSFEIKKNMPMTKRQYVNYRRISTAPITQPCSTIPTPRTIEKFTKYRLDPPGLLNLEPMPEERVIQLTSSPIKGQNRTQTPSRKGKPLPRL
jgi:hypothetical protein